MRVTDGEKGNGQNPGNNSILALDGREGVWMNYWERWCWGKALEKGVMEPKAGQVSFEGAWSLDAAEKSSIIRS